ncbi:putative Magnetosome protein MamH [Gammaproteobacteria bacterium]
MVLIAAIAFSGAWLARNLLVDAPLVSERHRSLTTGYLRHGKKGTDPFLSLMAAFTSRNDMVVVGLFLMTWFIYFADLLQGPVTSRPRHKGIVIGFMGVVLLSIPLWESLLSA